MEENILLTPGTGTQNNQDLTPGEQYDREMDTELSEADAAAVDEIRRNQDYKSNDQDIETLDQWHSRNIADAKEHRFAHQDEWYDEAPRWGHRMMAGDFISKLNQAGIRCWLLQGQMPGYFGFYAQKSGNRPEFVTQAHTGLIPEFEIVKFNEHGLPVARKRIGWRTLLLNLILKGFITEQKAHRLFGPAEGSASMRYNLQLFNYRNHK